MYHTETLYLNDRTIEVFGDYCAGYYWTCDDNECDVHGPFDTATDATVDALKQEI